MPQFGLDYYVAAAQDAVSRMSRTAKTGKIDNTFSGASDKPRGIISDPTILKLVVKRNIENCVEIAHDYRGTFLFPDIFGGILLTLAAEAVKDTIAPRATPYRTHEIDPKKGYGCPAEQIPIIMGKFYAWAAKKFNEQLTPEDVVVNSAIVEKVIDLDVHAFADACGRVSKLTSIWLAMRNDSPVKVYPGREVCTYEAMGSRALDDRMCTPEACAGLVKIYQAQPDFVM